MGRPIAAFLIFTLTSALTAQQAVTNSSIAGFNPQKHC